jgi:hypothetical protein
MLTEHGSREPDCVSIGPSNRVMTLDTIHANFPGDHLTGISDWNALREDVAQDSALIHDSHRRRDKLRHDHKNNLYCIVNTQNKSAARATERAFP